MLTLIMWLYLVQVMEENHQQNRISTSSPHHTALLVVSCHFRISFLGLFIKFMFDGTFVSPLSLTLHTASSIKVELCSDDESPGAPQPENREALRDESRKDNSGDPMEDSSAEYAGVGRDGASIYNDTSSPKAASPGPIRLPNGRLQCEVCGMICIGPNVLMVHKRSHTGENMSGEKFSNLGTR